jgi:hypothetical protein
MTSSSEFGRCPNGRTTREEPEENDDGRSSLRLALGSAAGHSSAGNRCIRKGAANRDVSVKRLAEARELGFTRSKGLRGAEPDTAESPTRAPHKSLTQQLANPLLKPTDLRLEVIDSITPPVSGGERQLRVALDETRFGYSAETPVCRGSV